jgi:predicted component of type VI protein secretion system
MSLALVLVRADGKSQEVALAKPAYTAGRATDCGLRLGGEALSRHHCEFTIEDAALHVRDLGSSNGTFVNRQRAAGKVRLNAGDLVSLGDHVFLVRINGKPEFIDAEESFDEGFVKPGVAAPAAKPLATKPAPAQPKQAQAAQAQAKQPQPAQANPAQAKPKPLVDPDGSSAADFDFFDEDDLKKQPKL